MLIASFFFAFFIAGGRPAMPQAIKRPEIPSSPNPVGSGARALGMGGAFIAVADDATAASWNPGGLIQLERPEVSVVGSFFHRTEDNQFDVSPQASGEQSISKATLNYLSASYPFTLFNRNMIISLNYQYLFDFSRKWVFPLGDDSIEQDVHYEQEGNLSAIGIAYSIQVIPRFSFGFTLNIWEDPFYENGWEQTTMQTGSGTSGEEPFNFVARLYDRYSFSGFNANVGILWHATGKLTLGAVLKTPFAADLGHDYSFTSSVTFPLSPERNSESSTGSREEAKLDMPMSYGLGLAYHFSDALMASLDVYRTEWQDFVLRDAQGNEISPITGKPRSESDIDATHQLRLGTEYLLIRPEYVLLFHGGGFYDPAPADGGPDNYFGVTFGLGLAIWNLDFDIAYQFRFGQDVGTSILKNLQFSQDVCEHTLYSSLVMRF